MSKKIPLYVALARTIAWEPPVGSQWRERREKELKALMDELPSGDGWDLGTKLNEEKTRIGANSDCERIVFYGEFHHMDENGFYDRWTNHTIVVTPSLRWGFELRVTGKDRNQIKDYLDDLFHEALSRLVWEHDYATHGGVVYEDREGEPIEVVWEKEKEEWKVYGWDVTRSVLLTRGWSR